MLPSRPRFTNRFVTHARALRRLAGRYWRSDEVRWRLLVLAGRYTSHIAIVSVVLLAVILAGAHLTSRPADAEARLVQPSNSPGAAAEAGGLGVDAGAAQRAASIPAPVAAGGGGGGGGGVRYSPRVFQTYVSVNNQDGALLARRAVTDTATPATARVEIITYTVQAGDTIEAIAARFGLLPTTLMWSNDEVEEAPDRLSIGQVLSILPEDGIWYTVEENDTLDGIAEEFKADVREIVDYPLNNLAAGANILPGAKLIVPRGVKPFVPTVVEQPGGYSAGSYTGPSVSVAANGTFQWPAMGYISQGFWWGHPALDIANANGVPIYASDSGYVSFAGWDGSGYGYMVTINHGNGFTTAYAHLSQYYVDPGQPVARGQIIAAMGSTGRSTGPHLHFEIRYGGVAFNPLYYLP